MSLPYRCEPKYHDAAKIGLPDRVPATESLNLSKCELNVPDSALPISQTLMAYAATLEFCMFSGGFSAAPFDPQVLFAGSKI